MKPRQNVSLNLLVACGALLPLYAAAQDQATLRDSGVRELDRAVERQDRGGIRTQLSKLPDLRPTGVQLVTEGARIEIAVDVLNAGTADSPKVTDRALLVTMPIINPLTGQAWYPPGNTAQSQHLWAWLPEIPAGRTARVNMGYVSLPNRYQDWDVSFEVSVDPRGLVIETNENNNTYVRPVCRFYGRNTTSPPLQPPSCGR